MSALTLRRFDALLTIVISGCWGLLIWGPGPIYPVSATMPVTHTLIGRSVIVPSTFRRTLWINVVASLPTIFVIATHHHFAPNTPSTKLGLLLSADLDALVLACLAKDREARPSSAAALRAALLSCKDAARYDPQAARAWWKSRGAELRRGPRLRPQRGQPAPLDGGETIRWTR
jgi:hypothetical protein